VRDIGKPTWNGNSLHTFFVLAEDGSAEELQKKLPALLKKYQDPKGYAKLSVQKMNIYRTPILKLTFNPE